MTRVVLLIRHAHAGLAPVGGSDHDRPLTSAGVQQAAALGAWLTEERGTRLEHVVASTAIRAGATADAIAAAIGGVAAGRSAEPAVTREARLYNCSLDTFLSILVASPPGADAVAVVGHNPTISHAATWLAGSPVSLPTAGAAEIQVDIDSWTDIAAAAGRGALRALRAG